jgi:hypothetical protein
VRTCRPRSASIAARSWVSTAHSISPVTTTVLTNTSNSSSDSLSGTLANGPASPRSVYQSAIAQTIALAVVTSRWPKRNATQMMKGMSTKVRPRPPANTTLLTATSSTRKTIASRARRDVHAIVPGALQLRISGAKISMPLASPCHQVHQLPASSAVGSG